MRIRFKSKKLEKLYTEDKGANKYPAEVVDAFVDVVSTIKEASTLQELYALEFLHFEKLLGDRKGERSLKLHGRWRLDVALEEDRQGHIVMILEITNHYE